jgi:predicted ATPase
MERGGIDQTLEAIGQIRLQGTRIVEPLVIGGVVQALIAFNAPQDALSLLEEVMAFSEQTGECWCDTELKRLKGEALLLQCQSNDADAESWFRAAIDTARIQQARSLELRAACSLARLLQKHGRRREGLQLLRPVYDWFTEGRSSKDHIAAAALLQQLAKQ